MQCYPVPPLGYNRPAMFNTIYPIDSCRDGGALGAFLTSALFSCSAVQNALMSITTSSVRKRPSYACDLMDEVCSTLSGTDSS